MAFNDGAVTATVGLGTGSFLFSSGASRVTGVVDRGDENPQFPEVP